MKESAEGAYPKEGTKFLPDQITRRLVIVKGRSGLLLQDMEDWVVQNQAAFGRGTDDYISMVVAHQNTNIGLEAIVLGIHEETRKRCIVTVGGQETEFVEAVPKARNIWVGENVKLMKPEEAENTSYAGQNALIFATLNKVRPEMVVRASNGYFYPASRDDIVMAK